jgi:hypothetical protein
MACQVGHSRYVTVPSAPAPAMQDAAMRTMLDRRERRSRGGEIGVESELIKAVMVRISGQYATRDSMTSAKTRGRRRRKSD